MSSTVPERPRVVVLKFSATARDPRVMRQVRLLAPVVDVVTVGYGPAPQGVADHVEIPTPMSGWRSLRLVTYVLYLLRWHRRLYFGSPRVRHVLAALPPGSMDVVLANDALGVPLGLRLAPRGGVHADLHEYAPRQGENRWTWRLLVAPLMRWACREASSAASATTVAPGIAAEYQRVFGFACETVPNAAAYRADLAPAEPATPLRLVHIGVAGRARRLEVMIDAVAQVEQQAPGRVRLDLYLAPGDPEYIAELEQRANTRSAGVVRVQPPVGYDEMVTTLARYDVGVFVCPPTTFNLAHALPNKFFEFIQARLGVLIGPSVEMVDYVERYGVGFVASGFDAAATAEAILALDLEGVRRAKAASHAHAQVLSSEELSMPWLRAVLALAERAAAGDGGAS